jgi:hypothetical protein
VILKPQGDRHGKRPAKRQSGSQETQKGEDQGNRCCTEPKGSNVISWVGLCDCCFSTAQGRRVELWSVLILPALFAAGRNGPSLFVLHRYIVVIIDRGKTASVTERRRRAPAAKREQRCERDHLSDSSPSQFRATLGCEDGPRRAPSLAAGRYRYLCLRSYRHRSAQFSLRIQRGRQPLGMLCVRQALGDNGATPWRGLAISLLECA